MKVKIVYEVIACDVSPVAMFYYNLFNKAWVLKLEEVQGYLQQTKTNVSKLFTVSSLFPELKRNCTHAFEVIYNAPKKQKQKTNKNKKTKTNVSKLNWRGIALVSEVIYNAPAIWNGVHGINLSFPSEILPLTEGTNRLMHIKC